VDDGAPQSSPRRTFDRERQVLIEFGTQLGVLLTQPLVLPTQAFKLRFVAGGSMAEKVGRVLDLASIATIAYPLRYADLFWEYKTAELSRRGARSCARFSSSTPLLSGGAL
jgi:hypothetical protein